jgi:hypothetical protein
MQQQQGSVPFILFYCHRVCFILSFEVNVMLPHFVVSHVSDVTNSFCRWALGADEQTSLCAPTVGWRQTSPSKIERKLWCER